MCGRFFVPEKDIDDFAALVHQVERELLKKAGEIFPGDHVPVITPKLKSEDPTQEDWHAIKWGFPMSNGRPVINARSETLNEKPMFKLPFATRRCLIPARGFFEWKDADVGKKRIKHYVSFKNEELMFFAGLYWFFKDKEGQLKPYFTIITTAANDDMKTLHDRMPVIITGEDKSKWLYRSNIDELRSMLAPIGNGALKIEPIEGSTP